MSLPLISVIVLTKNSSKTLDSCLDSVKNQSYSNVELVIVDSQSTDDTINIAQKHSAKIINTDWKLLGARYLGFDKSNGDYILYLDSDQLLYPDTIERSVTSIDSYDMLCLQEESYEAKSILQKLIDADRKLIHSFPDLHLDPMRGAMIPRFYKRNLIDMVFKKIEPGNIHNIVFFDDSIIYYEAYSMSTKVGVVNKAIMHIDTSSIFDFCRKSYCYGKTTQQLLKTDMYTKLLKRKARLRKGTSFNLISIKSIILFMLKNIPFFVGVLVGRVTTIHHQKIK
jgi:glycosyltransferase involved in cell wall biosynthesis